MSAWPRSGTSPGDTPTAWPSSCWCSCAHPVRASAPARPRPVAARQPVTTAPWRAIAPGPIEPSPALGDVTQVFHPWALWSGREARAGRVPLWNPYAYTGAPFFSNPQTACLFR